MQDIFEIIYHFINGSTYVIKTGVYYLAQVPDHIANFTSGISRFISAIPEPWDVLTTFSVVSSIALFFICRGRTT